MRCVLEGCEGQALLRCRALGLSCSAGEWENASAPPGLSPHPASRVKAGAGCAHGPSVPTRDEASREVELPEGLAEGAGHHAHAAEQPAQHHGNPAAKALHQDAAERPCRQRSRRGTVREEAAILCFLFCCNYPMIWSRDPEGRPDSTVQQRNREQDPPILRECGQLVSRGDGSCGLRGARPLGRISELPCDAP